MSRREAERQALTRLQLLELEASVQRAALTATLAKWERRKTLEWSGRVAGWGLKLLAAPKVRWLIATSVLSRLKRKLAR